MEDGEGGNNDVEVLGVNKEYDANEPEMGQENNGRNTFDIQTQLRVVRPPVVVVEKLPLVNKTLPLIIFI